jgi:hypothetical protein
MNSAGDKVLFVIPTGAERSEAKWRDLFFVDDMTRSLRSALRAPVGMTETV